MKPFLLIVALGMFANALAGRWALNFADRGAGWVLLDLIIAAVLVLIAWALWSRDMSRP